MVFLKGIYPLVNIDIANWNITMPLMGKLTTSMTIFNSYVYLPEGKVAMKQYVYLSLVVIILAIVISIKLNACLWICKNKTNPLPCNRCGPGFVAGGGSDPTVQYIYIYIYPWEREEKKKYIYIYTQLWDTTLAELP